MGRRRRQRHDRHGRRRRTGELWELWRMHEWGPGGDLLTPDVPVGDATGYIVTRGRRFPRPVAFVGIDARDAPGKALAIRAGRPGAMRAAGVVRLSLDRVPLPELLERPSFPVDRTGRLIIPARNSVTGFRYFPDATGERVDGYAGFIGESVPSPRKRKRRSGTPGEPHTPTPASNEGAEARALTAA